MPVDAAPFVDADTFSVSIVVAAPGVTDALTGPRIDEGTGIQNRVPQKQVGVEGQMEIQRRHLESIGRVDAHRNHQILVVGGTRVGNAEFDVRGLTVDDVDLSGVRPTSNRVSRRRAEDHVLDEVTVHVSGGNRVAVGIIGVVTVNGDVGSGRRQIDLVD